MTQMRYIFAQYNIVVVLAVSGGIRHLILTVLATWSVLSLYATRSHKISIFCPFAQWFGNGSYSLRLLGISDTRIVVLGLIAMQQKDFCELVCFRTVSQNR